MTTHSKITNIIDPIGIAEVDPFAQAIEFVIEKIAKNTIYT